MCTIYIYGLKFDRRRAVVWRVETNRGVANATRDGTGPLLTTNYCWDTQLSDSCCLYIAPSQISHRSPLNLLGFRENGSTLFFFFMDIHTLELTLLLYSLVIWIRSLQFTIIHSHLYANMDSTLYSPSRQLLFVNKYGQIVTVSQVERCYRYQ